MTNERIANTQFDEDVERLAGEVVGDIRKNWGWLIFRGVLLTILGVIGLYMAGTMTIVSILYFGIMVIAGGILLLVDAFQAQGWKAKFWQIVLALLYVACGIVMMRYPGASAVWFTLFIAAFLMVSGIVRIVIGLQVRKDTRARGWGWAVAGGIASVLLAFLIYAQWPISGLWVIGLFVAIEMLMQGSAMITLGLEAKASQQAVT